MERSPHAGTHPIKRSTQTLPCRSTCPGTHCAGTRLLGEQDAGRSFSTLTLRSAHACTQKLHFGMRLDCIVISSAHALLRRNVAHRADLVHRVGDECIEFPFQVLILLSKRMPPPPPARCVLQKNGLTLSAAEFEEQLLKLLSACRQARPCTTFLDHED